MTLSHTYTLSLKSSNHHHRQQASSPLSTTTDLRCTTSTFHPRFQSFLTRKPNLLPPLNTINSDNRRL
ncbi:hypothetical protein Hdeb2414_s0009g00327511 [Helianthus debilis subsp. tardiflorus]